MGNDSKRGDTTKIIKMRIILSLFHLFFTNDVIILVIGSIRESKGYKEILYL
jgi:hypothetical protein